jgi:multiple sugar transport system permease protein
VTGAGSADRQGRRGEQGGRAGRRGGETLAGLLWVSPWIAGTALFLLAPVGLSLYYSLTDYSLIERPVWIGLENYGEMLGDRLVWVAVRNTVLYAAAAVALGAVLSVGIAALLEQGLRGSGAARAIVFLPTVVPVVAASIGWMWLYNAEAGLVNRAARALGLGEGADWLGDRRLALGSLVVMGLWSIGSAVVVTTAAMRGVPRTLYEAAAMDGMGWWSRFRHVTLPMIRPAVAFNVIVSAIWSLQVFAAPLIMTKGGPEDATLVYTMYVWRNAFEYGRMGYASALSWVQFAATLAVTLAALRLGRRLVRAGGAG